MTTKSNTKRIPSMHLMTNPNKSDTTVKTKPLPLKDHTVKELVVLYNGLAKELDIPTLTAFRNKKSAIERVEKLTKEFNRTLETVGDVKDADKKTSKKTNKKANKKVDKKADKKVSTKRFTFGKKVESKQVESYIKETFGNKFKIIDVEFVDEHYWYCSIQLKGTDLVAKKVRVDYLVNYLRIPRIFKEHRVALVAHATNLLKG